MEEPVDGLLTKGRLATVSRVRGLRDRLCANCTFLTLLEKNESETGHSLWAKITRVNNSSYNFSNWYPLHLQKLMTETCAE